MSSVQNIPPTRAAWLELRQNLEQAKQGHQLLKRKQEVLSHELLGLIEDAEQAEGEMQQRVEAAITALLAARMRMGSERLRWASQAQSAEIRVEMTTRTIMGVTVPLLQGDVRSKPLSYGLGDTSVALDEARLGWIEVAENLAHWVETVTTVWRLGHELQRTRRRVNALEYVVIPRYEAAIAHIQSVLEEQEREEFMRAKRVKSLRAEQGEQANE
jgi:V/A-type H+-transporting ATPase subunit D